MITRAQRDDTESSRLDNFVDGAFAFAVTLLVINGTDIPHDAESLLESLRGIPAFAVCFAQLALFWYGHVQWREQIRSIDTPSLLLSLLLVFFALIFVYPLHMVFASFFHFVSGGLLAADFDVDSTTDLKIIFVCYGLAYACMAGTLAALFALGRRDRAERKREDRIEAGSHMFVWAFGATVGLLSAIAAALTPMAYPALISVSGLMYSALWLTGWLSNRYRSHLQRSLPA